jgi:hypothetical protein
MQKVALGQVFSKYFSFPCQFSFHRLLYIHHHLSSGAGTIGQLVADVPSGNSLTPPREINKKIIRKQLSSSTHIMQPPKLEQDRTCIWDTVCLFVYDGTSIVIFQRVLVAMYAWQNYKDTPR